MAGFRFDLFKGIRPRVSKRKLQNGEAQTASNTKLGSGDLVAWDENRTVRATQDPYGTKTIFLYETSDDNGYWFEWSDFVDVARGPIKGDTLDRVYFTGDGKPKVTYNSLQSAPPYPSLAYDLGVPKPLTVLQSTGTAGLPEDKDPEERRTSTSVKISTPSFEIVRADFTVYPGTGTPNDTWRMDATSLGGIYFDVNVGDSFKVLSVVDSDTVTLGSATGTGAAAATAQNTKRRTVYWKRMDEQGSTQQADFIGWRIPDGMEVVITDHLLRVGDIIRVTRLDDESGLYFANDQTTDYFELSSTGGAGDWGVPTLADGTYTHENVRLGLSADGISSKFEVTGGFYYDVNREGSVADILEDRTYVYTYVSAAGEEGPPSNPSSLISALDGDSITLTGFDLSPEGFRDIDRIRIYRTNATAVGTEYQLVKTVTIDAIRSDGGAVDAIEASLLGKIIDTVTWFTPPDEMRGITSMPNGMMVGFKGKNIYFSEPFQPHAWPPEYDQAVDYDVVALAPFGNSVAVLTEGTPYVITGSHPRNANIRPYKINQSCLYKESVALAKDRVYYASPDGLVEIGVNGARLATKGHVWKKEWKNFTPELMVGEFHDDKYFGFYGADNTVTPQPAGSVAVTGTLQTTEEVFESDIVTGGLTIILTLTGDTWIAAGATSFDTIRSDIIFSITGSQFDPGGWNNLRGDIDVSNVVRTSDTVVTITLPALPSYSIVDDEYLTFKAPALALTNRITLTAPETVTLYADGIYATETVVTTSFSDTDSLPEILVSDENIDNWRRLSAPGSIFLTSQTDLTCAAYHKSSGLWVAAGYDTGSSNFQRIITSDNVDDSDSWVRRFTSNYTFSKCALYEDTTDAVFVGGLGHLAFSYNAIDWQIALLPAALRANQLVKLTRSTNSVTPYVYGVFDDTKTVVRSAPLDSQPLTTVWEDLGNGTTGGTGHSACASGKGYVYVVSNEGTTPQIGRFTQGASTYTSIGALGMDVSDMVFGNGRLVCISANGRIQYADNPNTIGNWSAVSAAIDGAGTRDLARIAYDAGGDGRIGYGFIATLSASGAKGDYVVYTSPDAITWTLKETVSNASDALGIGVKYPETDIIGDVTDPNYKVTLSGGVVYYVGIAYPISRLQVRADGTLYEQRNNGTPRQLNAALDWIKPNFYADSTFDVRITNVVWISGSPAFNGQAAAPDTWIDLSADREWSVHDGQVKFDIQIRKDGGPVLASQKFSINSILREDPRDFR
jgi:hypothetical protein